MVQIWSFIQSRFHRESGATMIEYALILVVIAVVVLASALLLGPITSNKFVDTEACFDATC